MPSVIRAMSSAEAGARIRYVSGSYMAEVGQDIGKGCGMVSECGYSIVRDVV